MATPTTDHHVYATSLHADVKAYLKTLCETHRVKTFLEIGTGLGISTAWLAQRFPAMKIDTVEKNDGAAQQAYQLFATLNMTERIHVYHENAHQFYPVKTYDAILLDASKSQQKALVERFFPVLNPGGFMLIDNIHLSRIASAAQTASRESLKTKHHAFIDWLHTMPTWHVETLPIGDGIALLTPVKPYV